MISYCFQYDIDLHRLLMRFQFIIYGLSWLLKKKTHKLTETVIDFFLFFVYSLLIQTNSTHWFKLIPTTLNKSLTVFWRIWITASSFVNIPFSKYNKNIYVYI